MVVQYFKNKELAYTNRKRYNTFTFSPDFQEEQNSVLLGDGATTSIKTSKDNICNYVIIDGTRWYVTSFIYLNGAQVKLFLQRDVIGEFGLENCFGKVNRGIADNFIKYRKELSLNQILKKRQKLIPNTFSYGNYVVNTHENEKWGILYLVKPTGIDPNTGNPYENTVNVSIPAFTVKTVDKPFIENNTEVIFDVDNNSCNIIIYFWISAGNLGSYIGYKSKLNFIYNKNAGILNKWKYKNADVSSFAVYDDGSNATIKINVTSDSQLQQYDLEDLVKKISYQVGNLIVTNSQDGLDFPNLDNYIFGNKLDYNNIVIEHDNKFLKYSENISYKNVTGTNPSSNRNFIDYYFPINRTFSYTLSSGRYATATVPGTQNNTGKIDFNNIAKLNTFYYTYVELTPEQAGQFSYTLGEQLIDEPYSILICPLYDCKIKKVTTTGNNWDFNIEQESAFNAFNSIIQYLSGENGYLVDAQIYPYCPILIDEQTVVGGLPFFGISNTSYSNLISVQLLPNSDIKKEYIEREYSIVSPEKSGKFTFNFYDYTNDIINVNGINQKELTVIVKTALKPFSIITCAYIIPELGSLINITYDSQITGCLPTSNGFECSLASNQFESYKRNNSNYQQIFQLQKDELKMQHETERKNEIASIAINTMSASLMGGIAGATMADTGIGNSFGTKVAGGIAGAAIAGGVVGGVMGTQFVQNEKLRAYEQYLQQKSFDLNIGQIKNLPNTISRISSFNEIIVKDFWYVIETYECSDAEKDIVDNFINEYAYEIGVYDFISNYVQKNKFIKAELIKSNYAVNLHEIARNELSGGIYII